MPAIDSRQADTGSAVVVGDAGRKECRRAASEQPDAEAQWLPEGGRQILDAMSLGQRCAAVREVDVVTSAATLLTPRHRHRIFNSPQQLLR